MHRYRLLTFWSNKEPLIAENAEQRTHPILEPKSWDLAHRIPSLCFVSKSWGLRWHVNFRIFSDKIE